MHRFFSYNGSKCFRNVSAKKLHELFTTILSEITLPEKYIDLFQLPLRKLFTTINKEREENSKQYKTRLTELGAKKRKSGRAIYRRKN